jgi:glycosyltransferase involved in cell wall biosynthesis
MKKLLIATDNFLPRWDGIGRFLLEIVPKLSDEYKITIVAPGFKGYHPAGYEIADVAVHRFNTFNFKIGDFPPAIPPMRKIKRFVSDADIVWIQTIGPIGYAAAKWAKKMDRVLISFNHSIEWELVSSAITRFRFLNGLIRMLVKGIAKNVYRKCDLLMVPSKDTADRLKSIGIRKTMKLVSLGIDINKFKPAENKYKAKEALGIDPKKIVIGYVGRLGKEKDLITLYRAFVQLSYKYNNLILLVVGSGIESYKKLFSRHNMIYTGDRNDVENFYRAIDIYVLPSLTETTSLTTMEAMASGCAVLTTRVGAIPSYVVDRFNGMFFKEKNSYVLRKKLEMLIENGEMRRKLGVNARNTIEAQHSWDKTVEEIKKILNAY